MQNFNEQQLNLIKNSTIVFANWGTYKEVFKYLYANGGFGFQSEFFDNSSYYYPQYAYRMKLLQAGCFPFQEGLFVYIPNNGTAFVRSLQNEDVLNIKGIESFLLTNIKGIESFLLTFDKKTFDEFLAIKNDLIQKEKQQDIKIKCEVEKKPTLFEKMKRLFKK